LGHHGIDYRHTIDENCWSFSCSETPPLLQCFDIGERPRHDVVIVGNNDLSQFSGFAQDSPNTSR